MNTVRIGVIGIGNMGTAHASTIFMGQISGLTLTCVCDLKEERLQYCRENFSGVACYNNPQALIESGLADAVLIAVPHKSHADIAVAALQQGLHVLVEKPVDVSVTKAAELNRVAQQSGKTFAIMFNQRTNDLFRHAREIVQSGKLGALKRSVWIITNWYRTQHYYNSGDWRATWAGEGGGVLLNQAPHNLDLWQWICGLPETVTAVCDVAKYHNIEVEDDVSIFARYKNGATGVFITSTGEFPGTNRLEISGELGKIVLEDGVLKWWKLKNCERDFCFSCEESFAQIETEYAEYLPQNPETAHKGILQNFADAILNGAPLVAPGVEGINELMISNAAYLSSWKGNEPISLPPDGQEFDRLLAERVAHSAIKNNCETTKNNGTYECRWQVNW